MGRAGIRRRKRKHQPQPAEDTGVLADLEGQAEWSSYGQHIPRAGNPRRNAIWWHRGWRFYRNLGRIGRNPQIQDSGFWPAILVGAIGVVVFLVLAAILLLAFNRFA